MNYEDIKKSTQWISDISEGYIEATSPTLMIYKLNKEIMDIDPVYGEKIGGRVYLRPFEIKGQHLTSPFEFTMEDNFGGEPESSKIFQFNFNNMVKTINALKDKETSSITISAKKNFKNYISKNGDILEITRMNENDVYTASLNLKDIITISSLKEELVNSHGFTEDDIEVFNDDYCSLIPDFDTIEFTGFQTKLKTFNVEFNEAKSAIVEGDLIFVPDQNRLYEVESASPAGNMGWKYTLWNCKSSLTNTYVNYNTIKNNPYGLNLFK